MKENQSMNYMLVLFCLMLIGFVLVNSKMRDEFNKRMHPEQAAAVLSLK